MQAERLNPSLESGQRSGIWYWDSEPFDLAFVHQCEIGCYKQGSEMLLSLRIPHDDRRRDGFGPRRVSR